LVFGTRPKSETASALLNASSAAAARTCWITCRREVLTGRGATDSATKSKPVSAPALPAIATKRSRYVPFTTVPTILAGSIRRLLPTVIG
jgi:hypothetical protein